MRSGMRSKFLHSENNFNKSNYEGVIGKQSTLKCFINYVVKFFLACCFLHEFEITRFVTKKLNFFTQYI